jgi:hypothetical protein
MLFSSTHRNTSIDWGDDAGTALGSPPIIKVSASFDDDIVRIGGNERESSVFSDDRCSVCDHTYI